jgi:hypothetical protein
MYGRRGGARPTLRSMTRGVGVRRWNGPRRARRLGTTSPDCRVFVPSGRRLTCTTRKSSADHTLQPPVAHRLLPQTASESCCLAHYGALKRTRRLVSRAAATTSIVTRVPLRLESRDA